MTRIPTGISCRTCSIGQPEFDRKRVKSAACHQKPAPAANDVSAGYENKNHRQGFK
ncbi:hypothetical protein HOLDEFILI_03928 [Holdemania filiformis DSM 12042]|uniref:Uncharacterized protein n=1 Tax=Holdemania filiformis DSM 12042 TaxID=545696 RepID=B9YDK5_9FIRM|nr:hypothetical protein HOLDEFILI_03928 [Holdemania filiformis DSM 12042]